MVWFRILDWVVWFEDGFCGVIGVLFGEVDDFVVVCYDGILMY